MKSFKSNIDLLYYHFPNDENIILHDHSVCIHHFFLFHSVLLFFHVHSMLNNNDKLH